MALLSSLPIQVIRATKAPRVSSIIPSSFASFALDMPRLRYGGYNGGRQSCLPFPKIPRLSHKSKCVFFDQT